MSLTTGSRLGPYEILSSLGSGGMGEVYQARDTRLDRLVAIKVLGGAVAADQQFHERFEREARTISQLNHPNICTLHDVGKEESVRFLVMEYLEGETLAARLDVLRAKGKPLPVDEAVAIAIQVADALDVAHRAGIVHRDLKPGNVMLTTGAARPGQPHAKLLDFGLAKSARAPGVPGVGGPAIELAALSAPVTMTSPLTTQGTIVGTVQYMAPEQLEGKEADVRSDVFAFGAVVYEMLTGERAFPGRTLVSLMASILEHETRLPASGPAAVPPALARVVQKCLAKDPNRRWQSAGDLADELRWVVDERQVKQDAPAGDALTTRPRSRIAMVGIVAAALAAGVALTTTAMRIVARLSPPPAPQPVRFSFTPPQDRRLAFGTPDRDIAITPDGRSIVYRSASGETGLAVRTLGELDERMIAGATPARGPFISPDGRWVGYFSGNELKKISLSGGPPITLCKIQGAPRGASWGSDDVIVFATNESATGLLAVPASGGEPKVLTKPGSDGDHVFPSVLPSASAILFTLGGASPDSAQVAVLDRRTGRQTTVVRGGSAAEYVEPGRLIYAFAGTLRAIPFDAERLTVSGEAVPVLEQLATTAAGAGQFAISRDGTLVYVPGGAVGGMRSLVWIDRQGKEEAIKAPPRAYEFVRLSPDGTRAALAVSDQDRDIWIWHFGRETLTRLTFDPFEDTYPVWTPDGQRIAYQSRRTQAAANIFWQPSDGTGAVERLTTSPNEQRPNAFTPDGKRLVFQETGDKTLIDLKIMTVRPPGSAATDNSQAETLVQTQFNEGNADLSTDGRWLVYQSNESATLQVYVRPFPNVDSGRWQISSGVGSRPIWARNGRELFYLGATNALLAVPVQTAPTFSPGTPARLFDVTYGVLNIAGPTYDVSPDGRRFIVIKGGPTATENTSGNLPSIRVVEHWFEELKARTK